MDKERSGERMKLGAFFHPTGNHAAAWLHPDAQIDAGTNFRHYAEITHTRFARELLAREIDSNHRSLAKSRGSRQVDILQILAGTLFGYSIQ